MWTRLDDLWTERPLLAQLSYETRWHYLAVIQLCSRTGRIDGILTVKDARRCSDVDNPDHAVRDLLDAGLLEKLADGRLQLVEIDDHIPPPSVRLNSQNTRIRMRRKRAHQAGDHSMCLPDNCPHATATGGVTRGVTRNPRTGQDRTGMPKGNGSSKQEGERDVNEEDAAFFPR
jgi:hypothetical protein